MYHDRPCSEARRSDNCKSCNQLGSLRHILSDNTRVVRCEGIVDLNDIEVESRKSVRTSRTPVASIVMLCWYCPSKG